MADDGDDDNESRDDDHDRWASEGDNQGQAPVRLKRQLRSRFKFPGFLISSWYPNEMT